MNILYYSVHQILEDDEVRLLKSIGHSVCCLGSNNAQGSIQNFRPHIEFTPRELEFYKAFDDLGGKYNLGGHVSDFVIPEPFLDLFDVVIVMHDLDFVERFWRVLSRKPVVWRTIGQNMEHLEAVVRPYRAQGLSIVRYSPVETGLPEYQGHDAIIRFCKPQETYARWTGKIENVLTFSNMYKQRFPCEAGIYIDIVRGIPSILGGFGNDDLPGSIGMVDWAEQIELYRHSRAYLYASGLDIPYTLNFMEAWMTGTPMIVYAPEDRIGPYFEIDRLLNDGVDGFICRDVESARDRVKTLLSDAALARRMSDAGREAAIRLFSATRGGMQWGEFLSRFENASASSAARA